MNDQLKYWHCDYCHTGLTASDLHDITNHKVRCWQCWEDDVPDMLKIERFTDHRGALYTANGRSAMWQWIEAGCTQVALFETVDGVEHCYDGWIIQSEKADGVCQAWVEEHHVSYNFNYITSTVNRPAAL